MCFEYCLYLSRKNVSLSKPVFGPLYMLQNMRLTINPCFFICLKTLFLPFFETQFLKHGIILDKKKKLGVKITRFKAKSILQLEHGAFHNFQFTWLKINIINLRIFKTNGEIFITNYSNIHYRNMFLFFLFKRQFSRLEVA